MRKDGFEKFASCSLVSVDLRLEYLKICAAVQFSFLYAVRLGRGVGLQEY